MNESWVIRVVPLGLRLQGTLGLVIVHDADRKSTLHKSHSPCMRCGSRFLSLIDQQWTSVVPPQLLWLSMFRHDVD